MANWTDEDKRKVWDAWVKENGGTSNQTKDFCGAIIKFSDYGKRHSLYGWEIDHITTQANGGGDNFSNLRPLHFRNNLFKKDGHLKKNNKVYSIGNTNFIMKDGESKVYEIGD